jgi:hypothetical protein
VKQCKTCNEIKPLSEFYTTKSKAGFQSSCKECIKATALAWHYANPEQKASTTLKRKYGITLEQKIEMLAAQNNCCAMCGDAIEDVSSACVDHCHDSTVLRDILCSSCNLGLGHFRDSTERLERGILYLEKHATKNTTPPVPAGDYQQGEIYPELGSFSATGTWEDYYDAHHYCGANARKNADHSTQASSGDSVGCRGEEVGTPQAPESEQDTWELNPAYGWIKR